MHMHPAIPIIIVVVIVMVVFASVRGSNSHFICPQCGCNFQVKGVKYLFSPKTFSSHYVTCPKCGYSGYMDTQAGKK